MASTGRREEYRLQDGTWTTKRSGAIVVARRHVIGAALLAASTRIRLQFFVGAADHESGFAINERDTEESGFQTWGIFQLSRDEAREVGEPNADLLDLVTSVHVFSALMTRRLDAIVAAAKLDPKLSAEALPRSVWAYLAIAHNMGLASALKSIGLYGMDWDAYKGRPGNDKLRIVSSGYGDDVISGGGHPCNACPC